MSLHPRARHSPRPSPMRIPRAESHQRLGEILVSSGLVTREVMERVARSAAQRHVRLGEALVEERIVDESDVYRALATEWRLPVAPVDALMAQLDLDVVDALPRAYLESHSVLPLARLDDSVIVAVTEPTTGIDELAAALGARRAVPYLVSPTDFRRIAMLADARRLRPTATSRADKGEVVDLLARDKGIEARYVGLFDAILLEAIAERASDVHLERFGDEVRVRLRVDGDLRDLTRVRLTTDDLVGLVNVVKINASLDIAERRLPQGGRIRRRAGGRMFDLRVQTQPSLYGEHAIIRLLPQDARVLEIEELGMPPAIATEYRRLLDSPGGLVLVVGPTGSGKSTTLYAGLQLVAKDATRKVITAEDPIEYAVHGVQQSQVRPELGFAFQHAMRAFVREDPDVILVGEIRDAETALEAIRASQTGHLVLSTLHCNDATDAVQRLFDLGMHANSVASELIAVIAQRLAKRICDGCRRPAVPDLDILGELFPDGAPDDFVCFDGAGCARCGGHGTYGRIAVIEYLRSGAGVRRAISRQVPVDELRAVALAGGLVAMRESALALVGSGVIPMSEIPWLLPLERMAPEARGGQA